MKKEGVLILLLLMTTFAFAEACDLQATLLNQDPYPAVPGDYVKLVFQVEGVDPTTCSDITFELLEDYPIEFNPGETGLRTFKKVDYIKDYNANILIPFEVRIDKDALDGANPIDIKYQSKNGAPLTGTFDIEVTDVRTDFEIYVKDYDYATNEMTLEVLNTGGSDIEALTIEIPKQDIVSVKGASRIVVGDLDSNEYTSADFEAVALDGEFKVNLIYSDTIDTRRTLEKQVHFDSSYFTNRRADQKTTGVWTYVFWGAVVLLIGYWIYKKRKKKSKK